MVSWIVRPINWHQILALTEPEDWHQILALTEPEDKRLRSVRLMITGGDRANPADCRAAARAARGARLLNAYGLTETTITSTLFDVREELVSAKPSGSVPVGQPIGHAHVLVLDQNLNRVPAGSLVFPPVDEKLLDLNIDHLIATGYLRSPAGTAGFASLCRSAAIQAGNPFRFHRRQGTALSHSARI